MMYETFSQEKKSLRTTAQICWSMLAWRISTKNRCTPLYAFMKRRPVREGHMTVQDTSFAKLGRDIPVQELQSEINISA